MKIRKGFISNSSSTSFVVIGEVNETSLAKHLGIADVTLTASFIQNVVERAVEILQQVRLDEQEFPRWLKESWFRKNSRFVKDVERAIEEGKTVYYGTVSSDGCPSPEIESLMHHLFSDFTSANLDEVGFCVIRY